MTVLVSPPVRSERDGILTDTQLAGVARQVAALPPGYLLLRDPPSVPVDALEAAIGDVLERAGVTVNAPPTIGP